MSQITYIEADEAFYQEAPSTLAEFDEMIAVLQEQRAKFKTEAQYEDYLAEMQFRWFESTYLSDALERDKRMKHWSRKMIYLLFNPDNGLYKIGYSTNILHRLTNIQCYTPRVSLLGAFPGGSQSETQIHLFYKDKCVSGEWFDLTDRDVKTISRRFTQRFQ